MEKKWLNFLFKYFYIKKYGYKTEKSSLWPLAADDPLVDFDDIFYDFWRLNSLV